MEHPPQFINVTDRATAITIILSTDAYTPGNGLLANDPIDSGMVSRPIRGVDTVHLGWVKLKSKTLSPELQELIRCMKREIQLSAEFTAKIQLN